MSSTAPLAGRRVVVTRAADQSADLVERLHALGAEVIELPLIAITDPADGGAELRTRLAALDDVEWLVVTSPNGAARVASSLVNRPDGAPLVAAVGQMTETALGRRADLVPARQIAEGLVEEMPAPDGPGPHRVLIVQADAARSVVEEGLTAKGWDVTAVVGYRTAIAPPVLVADASWRAASDRARDADAVLFTSGSTARGWAAALGTSTPGIVVAIGPATAATAEAAGLKVTHVATDHSSGGVLEVLVKAATHSH